MLIFCLGLGAALIPLEKKWKVTNAQPHRDDPDKLCKYGLETEPQFSDEMPGQEELGLSFQIHWQFPKCTQKKKKVQQVAVLPGATHCTDGKYSVTKQNSGCDASIL